MQWGNLGESLVSKITLKLLEIIEPVGMNVLRLDKTE
jgi:hypothetical protein